MNYKRRLISIVSVLILCLSTASGCIGKKENKKTNSELTYEEIIDINNRINALPKYGITYNTDTYDVDKSISDLGIVDNKVLPYDMYKVIRYIDKDNNEIISIVNLYTNFVVENNEIISTYYTLVDAFTKNEILTTIPDKNGEVILDNLYEDSNILKVLDFGELIELRDIVISKGMDPEYAFSIMNDYLTDKSLLVSEVGRMYVLLVNSQNRLHNNFNVLIVG